MQPQAASRFLQGAVPEGAGIKSPSLPMICNQSYHDESVVGNVCNMMQQWPQCVVSQVPASLYVRLVVTVQQAQRLFFEELRGFIRLLMISWTLGRLSWDGVT